MTSRTRASRPARRLCTAGQFRLALQAASSWLEAQAERINALNVFPVPDGDTGTNMALTLRAAVEEALRLDSDHAGEIARAAAHGALMGARGNSGVILSQLLRGFARAVESHRTLGPAELAAALEEASAVAYRGVSRPVEGTMLTVSKRCAEAAVASAQLGSDLVDLLEHVVRAAGAAVAATPDQLEILRHAGVVDAGGEGLRVILEGAWMHATGREMEAASTAPLSAHALVKARALEEQPYGFCTEFVLQNADLSAGELRAAMEQLGDSVLVVGEGELVRVHVHTLRPGRALELAVDHGVLAQVKVENMELQHQQYVARHAATRAERVSEIGVIAVATGAGLHRVFNSLGAAAVVDGGNTMNPSVQDLLAAVNSIGYEQVIILPNNPNIVMTASSVPALTTRRVLVVPTTSIPQGVSALMAFNYEASLEANAELMAAAARSVRSLEVTCAVRDGQFDGVAVRQGQFIAVLDGRIVATARSAGQVALDGLATAEPERHEVLTIYAGADAVEEEARDLADQIRARYPRLEIEVVPGGQPHYPFILSLE